MEKNWRDTPSATLMEWFQLRSLDRNHEFNHFVLKINFKSIWLKYYEFRCLTKDAEIIVVMILRNKISSIQ